MLYLTTVLDFFLHYAARSTIIGRNQRTEDSAGLTLLKNLENKGDKTT
jgi:hypothetical protein